MTQPVSLHFTPTEQDYTNVLRLFFFQRTSTRVALGFLVVAFGLILYTVASQGSAPSLFQVLWLLLPPVFVAYVFFIQPSRMARQAVKNEQLIAEATWEVSDAGVEISSRFGSTHMDWSSLQKLVGTKEYYLLMSKVNKNAFRFLPLRSFTSPEEKEQFLDVVKKYLPVS